MSQILYCNVIEKKDCIVEYQDIFTDNIISEYFASSILRDAFEFENRVIENNNYIQPFLSLRYLFIDMINNDVLYVEIYQHYDTTTRYAVVPLYFHNMETTVSHLEHVRDMISGDISLKFVFKDKVFTVLI